jgi:predicted nucleic acid-binding protein
MTPVVVDTDVVSFLFKNDTRAQLYLLLAQWGAGRVQRFHQFMTGFAAVPSSRDLIVRWAEVMVAARSNGRRMEAADAWIAATALLYGAALVTHNPKDYLGVTDPNVLSRA